MQHIKYLFKTPGTAVVWIRHLHPRVLFRKVHDQSDVRLTARRLQLFKNFTIFQIGSEYKVKTFEIILRYLARPQLVELDTTIRSGSNCP